MNGHTENSPLDANIGPRPLPPLLTKIVSDSLLRRPETGFDWTFIETIGLPEDVTHFENETPEEIVTQWATANGYTSLNDADNGIQRPQQLLLCRPAKRPPHFKKLLVDNESRFLLRQALILSRCVKSTYDPDKAPIITAGRLQRTWDLYTIGGFYAPEY